MSDVITFHCNDCDILFDEPVECITDIGDEICPQCKGGNIFIRDIKYEVEPDRSSVQLGSRGCGTSGRFK